MVRPSLKGALSALVLGLLAACGSLPQGVFPAPADAPAAARLTLPSGRTVLVDPARLTYHGRARLQWPDGRTYDGQWLDGRPHGQGEEVLPDGTRYRGQWRRGERDGTGVLVDADGRRYVGDFARGVRAGTGTLTGPDGVYQGRWAADAPDGEGVFEGADGTRYQGQWQQGLRFGYGRYRTADGGRYRGDWAYDQPDGFGRLEAADGSVYQGGWQAGKRHGYGRAEEPSGLTYEGTWVAGRKQGFGHEARPDGSSYSGWWLEGQRHGQGLEVAADGSFHDGTWERDHVLGPGHRHAPTGIEISGLWNGDTVSTGLLSLPTSAEYAGPLFRSDDGRASPRLLLWLQAAAARGDPFAQLMLGTLYLDTGDRMPDVERARRWLEPAALAGIAEAQYRLALTYEHVNAPRVVELLAQAGRQAHPLANETLGQYYYAGTTVPRNLGKAISYFQDAADEGSLAARNNLAWLLATADQPRYRDADRAIALIRPIALYSGYWQYLDTLAAAWAAAGRFGDAVATARRAIEAAGSGVGGATAADVADLQHRLATYRAGQAYVEPPP